MIMILISNGVPRSQNDLEAEEKRREKYFELYYC